MADIFNMKGVDDPAIGTGKKVTTETLSDYEIALQKQKAAVSADEKAAADAAVKAAGDKVKAEATFTEQTPLQKKIMYGVLGLCFVAVVGLIWYDGSHK